jgi:hypothetical protein
MIITARDERVGVPKVDVSMNGIELQDREFLCGDRREARSECERDECSASLWTDARSS